MFSQRIPNIVLAAAWIVPIGGASNRKIMIVARATLGVRWACLVPFF